MSRYRPLVDKYLPRGAGAVFSFDCRGGRDAGQDFIRGVTLWSHLANVGDSKSLIIHPASTTHRQLDDEELRAAGVGPGTIRLSVGTEDVDDLIWDLEQGFARVAVGVLRGAVPMTPPFDLSRYQDPLTIQRVLYSAKTVAVVGPVEERAACELLRGVLPQATRLPRHSGQSARGGDPWREELQDPR